MMNWSDGPTEWVLVAGSDSERLEAIAHLLHTAGYGTEKVSSGTVFSLRARNRYYDLIIIDAPTGPPGAIAAVRAIRETETDRGQPPTPMAAIVPDEMPDAAARYRDAGVDAIFAPDAPGSAMLEWVRDAVTIGTQPA